VLAYVIRHAQSLANADQADELNAGLSPLGVQQTSALAARLGKLKVHAIYSSPFRRCLETAMPIATALGLPVQIRSELCEYHHLEPGTAQTVPLPPPDQLLSSYGAVVEFPEESQPITWPAIDESLAALIERVQRFATILKQSWQGEDDTVILFSHGSPIARLIEAWLTDQPGPSFRFVIDNAAISALRYHHGVSSLVCLNEISHLLGVPTPPSANFHDDGSIKPIPPSNYW
jgi:broad specificity phosphatase PhoE